MRQSAGDTPDPEGRATDVRVPDFFIIGHEKCGTTALYKMLKSHPQIFMPDFKEPRFFSAETRVQVPKGEGTRPRTLESYLALFSDAGPEQRVGEASPQYIRSATAAERIAEVQPDARIIAILREPASFLRSFHLQCVQGGLETERDLLKALDLEGPRREGRKVPSGFTSPAWLMYSEHVRYVDQLRRFEAQFSKSRLLVLIYDEYRRDNEHALRQVFKFLEVAEQIPIAPAETSREPYKAVRLMALHKTAGKLRSARHQPERAGLLARTVVSLVPTQVQLLGRRVVYKSPDPPDEGVMLELRRRFKPEVEAASEYLGRDLVSLWGYDKL